ncbi:hypothetical protein J5U23_00713 [Saccharolobus shibatae B12]|uniref:Uncharacterized protein n=1 Tax=Saccharolobus shibatae (strain ATCC 51178 / DSM 5389 / JCM 8931 / NBRC 15437 / B12) TaxID=523848 RepID=A0A8F5BM59_SACSH|nr:hypothetical protein J5U23_00713 [Saccharolobus shibatae B12]
MKYVTKVMDSIGGGGEGGDAKVYVIGCLVSVSILILLHY